MSFLSTDGPLTINDARPVPSCRPRTPLLAESSKIGTERKLMQHHQSNKV
jgi:hypothetical protein